MERVKAAFSVSIRIARFHSFCSFMVKLLALMVVCGCLAAAPAASAETLRIGGTGGAMGAVRLLAEEFKKSHPHIETTILPHLGTSGGIKALIAGELDISISSRPLKESERGQGLTEREYARTPFVFAVSKRSAVSGVTRKQIVDIYSGAMATWPDGVPVRVVLRPAADTDTAVLKAMSAEMKSAVESALSREGMIMATRDQECADALEKIAGSIGPSTVALLLSERRQLKALPLDGVAPTSENAAQGRYPYFKHRFVITKGTPSPAAQAFIAFIASAKGRRILTETGHWIVGERLK